MNKMILVVLAVIVLGASGILAVNYYQLQSPMNSVLRRDPRNDGVDVSVHYSNFVNPSTLVFDLRTVTGSKSPEDVFRVLLQYADRIKDMQFDDIALAYKGVVKFRIDGRYFRTLGEEYGVQTVLYTIRTFPEHLKTAAGTRAYPEWTGARIGVMKRQIKDFNDFHRQWYLAEQKGSVTRQHTRRRSPAAQTEAGNLN